MSSSLKLRWVIPVVITLIAMVFMLRVSRTRAAQPVYRVVFTQERSGNGDLLAEQLNKQRSNGYKLDHTFCPEETKCWLIFRLVND